jgi:hypothetical protein
MRRSVGSTIDPGVFGISLGISMLFVLWGVMLQMLRETKTLA